MYKKIIFALIAIFFCAPQAGAANFNFQGTLDFLQQNFPENRQLVGKVSQTSPNKLIFTANKDLEKNRALLVLDRQKNKSYHLSPLNSILQINSKIGNRYVAKILSKLDGKGPSSKDPVVVPASPTVYLYSNIKNRDGFQPYQKMLQKLIQANFPVVELYEPEVNISRKKYSLLLRLEGTSDKNLVSKVQSIYSRETMYSQAHKGQGKFQISAPVGKDILLKEKIATQETKTAQVDQSPKKQSPTPKPGFEQVDTEVKSQEYRLEDKFNRLNICQLDSSPEPEFVLLNNNKLQVFKQVPDGLKSVYEYSLQEEDLLGLHLHSMQLDKEQGEELILTLGEKKSFSGAENTELRSKILTWENNKLQVLADRLPYYLRVIENRSGEEVLLAQKKGNHDPFTGKIYKLQLGQNAEINRTAYPQAKDIYSIYQFNLAPQAQDTVMILEPSNIVTAYHSTTEKIRDRTDRNLGEFNILPYPIKLERTKVKDDFEKVKSRDYYAPRRFCLKTAYGDQMFTINAQRKSKWNLDKLKDFVLNTRQKDSLLAFEWAGESIQNTWESEELNKDILDFAFLPGKKQDRIFLLLRDSRGFALQSVN